MVSEGDLPLKMRWTFNDTGLEHFPEVSVGNAGRRSVFLTIESVSYANAGEFRCHAKNAAGEDQYATKLLVNGC